MHLSLCFQSPWHCDSGEGGLHTDRIVQRDARNLAYVPGSTLRGVVREQCEKLARSLGFPEPTDPHEDSMEHPDAFVPLVRVDSPVDRLFGTAREEGGLFFRDARVPLDEADEIASMPLPVRNRIARYRRLGTAREHRLFNAEYAREQRLVSVVDGRHPHVLAFEEGDLPFAYSLLVAAVLSVDRLGGEKSVGCGRLGQGEARRGIRIDGIQYNGEERTPEEFLEYLEMSDLFREQFAESAAADQDESTERNA